MSISEILSFTIASIILAFTPGPDTLFVMVTGLGNGFKMAFKFILGLVTGIILHTSLMAIGISTLISQSQYGLTVLKYFAIIYLLYLAYKTFIHRNVPLKLDSQNSNQNFYWRGFIMNISNPKVLLFFIAFFPQFAHLNQSGYQMRLILLGLIFIVVTLVVFSFIAWLSAMGSDKIIKNPKYSLVINYLAIVVFVSVSVWFLLS